MRRYRDQKGASDLAIVVLLGVMAIFVGVSLVTNWMSQGRKEESIRNAEWQRELKRKKKEEEAYLKRLEELPTNQRFR